jgi:hypothetical protein
MVRSGLLMMLALGLLHATVRAEDTPEDQARAVVAKFLKAVKEENVQALLPTVAVPWLHSDLTRITEQEKLGKAFEVLFEKRDYTTLTIRPQFLTAYQQVRNKTDAEERKLLDEYLGDQGFVVLLQIEHPDQRKEKLVLLVRILKGQAKVVGIKN